MIALSLRFPRLDYFWFTLLHELAHLVLHNAQLPKLEEPCDGGIAPISAFFSSEVLADVRRDPLQRRKTRSEVLFRNPQRFSQQMQPKQLLGLKIATPGIAEYLRDLLDDVSNDRWCHEAITEGFPGAVERLARFCAVVEDGPPAWWLILKASPTFREAVNVMAEHARTYADNCYDDHKKAEDFRQDAEAYETLGKALTAPGLSIGDICKKDRLLDRP